ncbi:MAG: hypothetical protein ACT4OS_11415 [Acidimicrobiales bacterium]
MIVSLVVLSVAVMVLRMISQAGTEPGPANSATEATGEGAARGRPGGWDEPAPDRFYLFTRLAALVTATGLVLAVMAGLALSAVMALAQ